MHLVPIAANKVTYVHMYSKGQVDSANLDFLKFAETLNCRFLAPDSRLYRYYKFSNNFVRIKETKDIE